MLPPQGFQKASTLLKSPSTSLPPPPNPSNQSLNSHRDASGGLPPIPKPPPEPVPVAPSNDESNESEASTSTVQKPVNRPKNSKNAIMYNAVQRKNPVLQGIRGVGVEIADITADYQVGTHNGVLFLSLKYHRLHPEYIHTRIEKMKNKYNVRILLILCDISEHQQSIRELSKTAVINELTVFVAWSSEEAAQYLTTFKTFEHKSAELLKEKIHQTYPNQLQHVLTSGKKVSKTDATNLGAEFGSFANIVHQPSRVLSNVKGLGSVKVTSLIDAFTKPFLVGGLKRGEPDPVSGTNVTNTNRKGKEKASEEGSVAPVVGEEDNREVRKEREGSPDWPDEDEGDEDDPAVLPIDGRGRGGTSRSPGLSPEPSGGGEIWADPLNEEEDEEESEDATPANKRARKD